MSRFVTRARAFFALRHHTAESRAARVAIGLALSLSVHAAAWFGVHIAPPPAGKPRPALSATLTPELRAADDLTFVLPPQLIEPETSVAVESLIVDEAPALTPQGALISQHDPQQPSNLAQPANAVEPVPHGLLLSEPDAVFYSAGEVDRGAMNLSDIKPQYPVYAQERGVEGSVDLLVYIDEAGFVRDVRIDSASPAGFFEQAAIAAFRSAQFSPAYKNDRAVKSQKRIRVSFDLTEGELR